jgi:hypothetical protein
MKLKMRSMSWLCQGKLTHSMVEYVRLMNIKRKIIAHTSLLHASDPSHYRTHRRMYPQQSTHQQESYASKHDADLISLLGN